MYKQLNDYFIFGDYIVGDDSGRPLTNGYFDCTDTDTSKQEGSLLIDFPAPFNPKKTLTRNSAHDMHMYYLKSDVYSYLVPDVKLYKVVYNAERIQLSADQVLRATVGSQGVTDQSQTEVDFPAAGADTTAELGNTAIRYGIDAVVPFEMPLAVEDQSFNPDPSYPLATGLGALMSRSGQIGVKSFNWRYLGTNRFTADKDIEAELVLRMDGIEALFAERVDTNTGRPYKMSDLLILADDYKRPESEDLEEQGRTPRFDLLGPSDAYEYREQSFEIIVDAGYHIDPNRFKELLNGRDIQDLSVINDPSFYPLQQVVGEDGMPQLDLESLDKFKTSMFLTVIDHDFTFNENGSVELKIQYRGREGARFRTPEYDILMDSFLKARLLQIEAELKPLDDKIEQAVFAGGERGPSAKSLREQKAKLQKEKNTITTQARRKFFQNVMNIMVENNKLYNLTLDNEAVTLLHNYLARKAPDDLVNFLNYMSYQTNYLSEVQDTSEVYTNFTLNDEPGLLDRSWVSQPYTSLAKLILDAGDLEGKPDNELRPERTFDVIGDSTCGIGLLRRGDRNRSLPYVFFGDIIDAVLQHSQLDMSQTRIILGDMRLPNLSDFADERSANSQNTITLAAIPITIPLLFKFITDLATNNNDLTLTLTGFLQEAMSKLIPQALGSQDIENALGTGDVRTKATYLTHFPVPDDRYPDDPTKGSSILDEGFAGQPQSVFAADIVQRDAFTDLAISIAENENVNTEKDTIDLFLVYDKINSVMDSEQLDYLVQHPPMTLMMLHVEDKQVFRPGTGNIRKDFLDRIPHFSFGQNYGLIKRMQLQKTDQPFLREGRFEATQGKNNLSQLSNVYDATFDMVGNDLNTLGGMIYFNPTSLAPNGLLGSPQNTSDLSYLLGLGGLHLITLIDHKMTPGNYTTSVKARFISRGEVIEDE